MWNLAFPAAGRLHDPHPGRRLGAQAPAARRRAARDSRRSGHARAALPAADRPGLTVARLHRPDRHPVPELALRAARLPRRDGGDGDRVGHDPAAVGADPALRRLPGVGPDPDRAASPTRRGTSGSWSSWRPSATPSARSSATTSAPRAAGRSSSATASTCSSGRTRSSSPTTSSSATARRRPSSAGCCRSCGRSSASRPASRGCRSGKFILYSTAGAFIWSIAAGPGSAYSSAQQLGRRSARAPAVRPADRRHPGRAHWRCSSGGGSGMPGLGRAAPRQRSRRPSDGMPTRDEAWALLCEWTQSDALRKHGRAVEGAVGWYGEQQVRQDRRRAGDVALGRPAARLRLRALPGHSIRCAAPTSCAAAAIPEERGPGRAGPRRPHRRAARRPTWRTPSTPATR